MPTCRAVGLIFFRQYVHDGMDVRDMGPGMTDDTDIAAYATSHSLCLLTGDFGFADIRNYPPADYNGILV